jgi:hypothetical protein
MLSGCDTASDGRDIFPDVLSDDETLDGSRSTMPTLEEANMNDIVKGDVEVPVMVMGVHGLNKEDD